MVDTTPKDQKTEPLEAQITQNLEAICSVLRERTGHDFRQYREGTLARRIGRRLQLRHVPSAIDYLQELREQPAEAELLVKELLIGITEFFRNPDAFQVIADLVLPRILDQASKDAPLRIWVPGCASGEESYSLAMLVAEELERRAEERPVRIFATDIDTELLARARQGCYPADQPALTPDRISRFFERRGSSVRVIKKLREMCIFSAHSLIKDPPFSSLDLISCRNVLIYLETTLQQKLGPLFHYALRPDGVLFLGPSEGLVANPELFTTLSKKHRVFERREPASRPKLEFPLTTAAPKRPLLSQPATAATSTPSVPMVSQAFERVILAEYVPACAVVNERGEILYQAGPTSRYLQPPPGGPSHNILDVADTALSVEIRSALFRVARAGRRAVRETVTLEGGDQGGRRVLLSVRPLPGLPAEAGLYLAVLQDPAPSLEPEPRRDLTEGDHGMLIEELTTELRTTRNELESAIQELASTNEQLKASNEELISTNEELQSSNEELQTSQHELQTLNEKLERVNNELQDKVKELGRASADLQVLYASTQIATVFLDQSLRVTRFTPAAAQVLHLIDGDLGRPLADLAPRLEGHDLVAHALAVFRNAVSSERQVRTVDGAWFMLRILPHRGPAGEIAGVVATLVDISELKSTEEALRRSEERFLKAFQGTPDALLISRVADGRIVDGNEGFCRLTGYLREEALGRSTLALRMWVWPEQRESCMGELRATGRVREREVGIRTKSGRPIDCLYSAEVIRLDEEPHVLSVLRDVTEAKRAAEERERLQTQLFQAQKMESIGTLAGGIAHDFNNILAGILSGLSIVEDEIRDRSEVREDVAEMIRLVERGADLTKQLLGFARRGKFDPRPLDLNRVVEKTGRMFGRTRKELVLRYEFGASIPAVLADRTQVEQVILNLLLNAGQSMADGGEVSLRTEPVELLACQVSQYGVTPGCFVKLSVRDSGAGMDAATRARVFEPFFTTKQPGQGTGLGLASVYGIVQHHGGFVTVDSEIGKGSTFSVFLPATTKEIVEEKPTVGVRRRGHETILVVDDEDYIVDLYSKMLRRMGYEVLTATSGREAVEIFRENQGRVALVILDMIMPGMSGRQTFDAIRGIAPGIRVLLASGYAIEGQATELLDRGCNGFIQKPFNMDALSVKLRELL